MAIGISDNRHYINTANAIRDNSFGYIEGPLLVTEFPQRIGEISAIGQEQGRVAGYTQGLEAGKESGAQSESDRFWDVFQQNGTRTYYGYAFAYGWNKTTFAPKYDIKPTVAMYMFNNSQIEGDLRKLLSDQGVILDFSQCRGRVKYAFAVSKITALPTIDLTGLPESADEIEAIFGWTYHLHTIDALILKDDGSTPINDFFNTATALENIVIKGTIGKKGFNVSWSTKLTRDSLMSIINALQDKGTDTSGTIWAITLGTTNLAKLTDAEKAIATQKGWTLA